MVEYSHPIVTFNIPKLSYNWMEIRQSIKTS